MYVESEGRTYLDIRKGLVDVSGLQCAGLGVADPPAWETMKPLEVWLEDLKS